MKEYQVTLFCADGKYKPVSTIVKSETDDRKKILQSGMKKICMSKYWKFADLKKYGYTQAKIRIYDKAMKK